MSVEISADLPRLDDLPRIRTTFLRMSRLPVAFLLRRYWRVQIHDEWRVPSTGPVIMAVNHVGLLDGPLLVAVSRRLSFALAKVELFNGVMGRLLMLVGQIPVDRSRADITAISRSIQVLRDERVLAVFPEGARGAGDVQMASGGAAYFAMVTGAPIIPVALLGTRVTGQTREELPPRGAPLHVVFGPSLQVNQVPWPRRKASVAELTERMRKHLADHVVEAQERIGLALPGPPKPLTPRAVRGQ